LFDNIRREEDEYEVSKLKSDDRSSRSQLNNGDTDETRKSYSSEVRISPSWAKELLSLVLCTLYDNFSLLFSLFCEEVS